MLLTMSQEKKPKMPPLAFLDIIFSLVLLLFLIMPFSEFFPSPHLLYVGISQYPFP